MERGDLRQTEVALLQRGGDDLAAGKHPIECKLAAISSCQQAFEFRRGSQLIAEFAAFDQGRAAEE